MAREKSVGHRRGAGGHGAHTSLSAAQRDRVAASRFAFPEQRKEPLTDASHVRNAVALFDQVGGVSDADRAAAWKRIRAAAGRYGVDVEAKGWRDLMKRRK